MQCIIFTDTDRLAGKYGVSQQDVRRLLERGLMANISVEFLLLDAYDYQEMIEEYDSWHGFKAALLDFMQGMGLETSPQLALFIVGGDDVIPMPRIDSPVPGIAVDGEPLQADLLYCFEDDELDCVDYNDAICNVGRLPMENDGMETTIDDDLQSYINLSTMFLDIGLDVENVVMTSTQSWLPASSEMIKGLPVNLLHNIPEATHNNMYTSPGLTVDNKAVLAPYKSDLSSTDMLMFNLHGSHAEGTSSFYGEDEQARQNPEAFNIEMLKNSNARIINTVACYGARFVDYERGDSMLLSAIYGAGVMLYAGSCVSALGRSGAHHEVARDLLIPAGMSESFMKLYSLYLFTCDTAGEAFLKAKCDYFNTCRKLDGDDMALATILEFNLYGLPILHVNRKEEIVNQARGVKPTRALPVVKQHTEHKEVYRQSESHGSGLLDEIRSLVDNNLREIRQVVEAQLYKYWGLNPRHLTSIEELSRNGNKSGMRFVYEIPGTKQISKSTWAYTDNNGEILDVVHLK